jgi:hypothetical protein
MIYSEIPTSEVRVHNAIAILKWAKTGKNGAQDAFICSVRVIIISIFAHMTLTTDMILCCRRSICNIV